jgi:hypothetical protein
MTAHGYTQFVGEHCMGYGMARLVLLAPDLRAADRAATRKNPFLGCERRRDHGLLIIVGANSGPASRRDRMPADEVAPENKS